MASLPSAPTAPGTRRPTLRDVAALAGVSFKTVSRVVNGEPGVSTAVTDRVREAADALGYRPNAAATALRRADGRTATFGVLLEDAGNHFFAMLLRGIEDVARLELGVRPGRKNSKHDLLDGHAQLATQRTRAQRVGAANFGSANFGAQGEVLTGDEAKASACRHVKRDRHAIGRFTAHLAHG